MLLTHVTSKETKKSRATFVYPHAALLASMAARFLRPCADIMLGGNDGLPPAGGEAMLTEYCAKGFLKDEQGL